MPAERDDQLDAVETTIDQVAQERRPARLVLLGALANAQDLPITVRSDPDRHQQRDITHLAGPTPLHDDPVEENVRMSALNGLMPPSLDLRINLLVEVRHRRRADPRSPKGFGDVLDPSDRNTGQIHLNERFLDRALTPLIAFDDRRLECLPAQLRNLQLDVPGLV